MPAHTALASLRRHVLSALAAVACAGATVGAHDFWIEPSAFRPDAGSVVAFRLFVGQDLAGDPVPRDPALIDRFVLADAAGQRPVVGRDGVDPAGLARIGRAGLTVVGYQSRPAPVTLKADAFTQYLREEGLEHVIDLRARRRESDKDARELYVRCAKSLLQSGAPDTSQRDQTLGLPLELVGERNPYTLGDRRELPVRLTYEGRPLAGALVVAISRANPKAKIAVRSDANGRVRFTLPSADLWLIKAVHMVPAQPGSGADWASYWASLTFDLAVEADR